MASALTAVVAGMTGVVVGGVLNLIQEYVRHRRENRTRFHEEKRSLYARFLAEAEKVHRTLLEGEPEDMDEEESLRDLYTLFAQIQFVASEGVLDVATELVSHIRYSSSQWQQAYRAMGGQVGRSPPRRPGIS